MTLDLRAQLQQSLGDAYRFERELGGGGMSRVFVAVETALDRQVVVKVLLPELAAGVSVERFRREIQLAAQLQHPHIVPLLAAGESAGLPYFTMPFVVGESLRARLQRDRELPVPTAIRLLRDIASALDYAHGLGIVHRDIKPDNVLLTHGVGVVTDFGVAKALTASGRGGGLTSMGVTLGTPAYMAPEQASADPAMDHRVDIYAFGIMGYEMLTGQPPFTGRSPQQILGAHLAQAPEPVSLHRPALPPALATLVMRCLEKHAADRPQTAGELMATLDTLTTPSGGTIPISAASAPTRFLTARKARRSRQRLGIGLGGAAAIAAVAVWAWLSRPAAQRPVSPGPTAAAPAAAGEPPVAPAEDADSGRAAAPPAARPETAGSAGSPAPAGKPAPRRAPEAGEGNAAMLARLEAEARSARRRATEQGAAPEAIARGDSAVARAESLRAARRTAAAAGELSAAIGIWSNAPSPAAVGAAAARPPAETTATPAPAGEAPAAPVPAVPAVPAPAESAAAPSAPPKPPAAPPPPADQAPRIRALFDRYAAALETRSVDSIRQAYPGLTQSQALEWHRFFGAVSDLRVTLRVTRLDVRGDMGEADLAGIYVFTDPGTHRTRQDSVSLRSTLRRDGRGWRIEALR